MKLSTATGNIKQWYEFPVFKWDMKCIQQHNRAVRAFAVNAEDKIRFYSFCIYNGMGKLTD
jgi:hypothetical protein